MDLEIIIPNEVSQTKKNIIVYWSFICGILRLQRVGHDSVQFSSVQISCSVMSDSLRPPELQHAKLPCPSPTPEACSNSCPSRGCHPTISSSVPFSSCLQSFTASRSFQMSHFFASGGQSFRVSTSASVLPMNIHNWFPFRLQSLNIWLTESK